MVLFMEGPGQANRMTKRKQTRWISEAAEAGMMEWLWRDYEKEAGGDAQTSPPASLGEETKSQRWLSLRRPEMRKSVRA